MSLNLQNEPAYLLLTYEWGHPRSFGTTNLHLTTDTWESPVEVNQARPDLK